MFLGEYRFHATFTEEAILPPCKGSTFRGVFGRALKEVACALKRQECSACLLRHQCVYSQIFEPCYDQQDRGHPTLTHPFVIEPPITLQTNFSPGDSFDFTLLLFGSANRHLPYFVYAFEQMGSMGVGRRILGRRARFRLETVTSPSGVIYRQEDRCLLQEEGMKIDLDAPASESCGELTVALVTPLRLKYRERLQAELPFHVLIRAVLRRIATLLNQFGNGEPVLDYRGLVARAEKVRIIHSTVRWFDWERYSNRQERSMLLGGMIGKATYEGDLGEFLPLLKYVEKVHLGKATTFGLGKIKLVT